MCSALSLRWIPFFFRWYRIVDSATFGLLYFSP